MKTYDYIKELLTNEPELRNSDKKLIWRIYKDLGYVKDDVLTFDAFMDTNLPNFETLRRTRQKIQEHYPQLQASESVQRARKVKQMTKSTFVYREEVEPERPEMEQFFSTKFNRILWREKKPQQERMNV